MAKKSNENTQKSTTSATTEQKNMWYRFYIEPYFDKDDIARLKQSLQQSNDTLNKQFSNKKFQEQHFPILLPFMLSNEKFDNFVQNYLNIGLHHRRNFSNAQNMIRANITQLDILSYKEDSFYRHFVELAKIDQEIKS